MKTLSSVLVAAVLGIAVVSARTPSPPEKDIAALEKKWAECFVTGNPDAARKFIGDDFVGITSKAARYGKTEAIEEIVDSKGKYRSLVPRDITVRVYGDAAVSQGTDDWEMADGSHTRGSAVWTDTWIRRNGRWVIVAAQDTPLP